MILTRAAETALRRVAAGRPAFGAMLPPNPGQMAFAAEARQTALAELLRLRCIKRGPLGPVVTATGRRTLEQIDRFAAGAPATEVFGMTAAAMAERLGISRGAVKMRAVRIRRAEIG